MKVLTSDEQSDIFPGRAPSYHRTHFLASRLEK